MYEISLHDCRAGFSVSEAHAPARLFRYIGQVWKPVLRRLST
jgi:hypothetical protein